LEAIRSARHSDIEWLPGTRVGTLYLAHLSGRLVPEIKNSVLLGTPGAMVGCDMRSKQDTIYEIKVTLRGVRPPIWRRLHIPATYSFWDLHVAIQDAMGWMDSHLHEFRVVPAPGHPSLSIGIPDEDDFDGDESTLPGWKIPITKFLSVRRKRASYTYDFGDGWEHSVLVEKVLQAVPGARYPACVSGRRHCPPEDVGGVPGYENFLMAIRDPTHEEHESYLTWVDGPYDPEAFDPSAVHFDDPQERWRIAILDEGEDDE
jgi:hypothetical protein